MSFSASKFLIVNGIPVGRRPPFETQASEVIDINDKANDCENFNEYPVVTSESTGVRIKDKVIICGGMNQDRRLFYRDDYESVFDRCYIGDQNGFKLLTRLPHKPAAAASLVYNDTMWLTGGSDLSKITWRNSQRCNS